MGLDGSFNHRPTGIIGPYQNMAIQIPYPSLYDDNITPAAFTFSLGLVVGFSRVSLCRLCCHFTHPHEWDCT